MAQKTSTIVDDNRKRELAAQTVLMLAKVLPDMMAGMMTGGAIVIHVAPDFQNAFIEPPPVKQKNIQVHIG